MWIGNDLQLIVLIVALSAPSLVRKGQQSFCVSFCRTLHDLSRIWILFVTAEFLSIISFALSRHKIFSIDLVFLTAILSQERNNVQL